MPSEQPARRLLDIVGNARAILSYTAGMDGTAFEENRLVSDAVERCLERISEPASKLGDLAPALVPELPWPDIRALGNRLRHEYDEIGQNHLWEIVPENLPELLVSCERALQKLQP